jgi:acyl-CoA reductase-like NAD-dependent aldehyde dehydrogenase
VFIGGRWIQAGGRDVTPVTDSATEEVVGEVRSASGDQLDHAIEAAREAQEEWVAMSSADRAARLGRLHEELSSRSEQLAALIASEVGTPLRLARSVQVGLPLTVLSSYVQLLQEFEFEERVGNSLVVREPVGVVGAITPWNYPLHQTMAKVAAALAAGCTVVHKPSGLAPLNSFVLAEAVEAAELPAGVFNLVPGPGSQIGDAMSRHHGIDMISFTGSTAAGTQVAASAAASVKRVALELGGKSASVVLEDAELPRAVAATLNNAMLNSGQTCNAWTRLIAHKNQMADIEDLLRQAVARLPLGDPFDERTRLGPLISREQVDSVRRHVEGGLGAGARLLMGGPEPPTRFERGFYLEPTVFTEVTPDMAIAREEIFGPVLCVMSYSDEREALRLANATEYGLAGAVWSGDGERAARFARRMRTGQVDINGGRFNPLAPFGGHRRSGVGRELGRYGLEEFLELKALQF